jgi:hypothetical protein
VDAIPDAQGEISALGLRGALFCIDHPVPLRARTLPHEIKTREAVIR